MCPGTHYLRNNVSRVPGRASKRGLNEALARARLGRLHTAIERKALRDGGWGINVHPGGTSITCSACGHRKKDSRTGERFGCAQCGHTAHADQNAAVNIATRGGQRLEVFLGKTGGRDGGPVRAPARTNGQGRIRTPGTAPLRGASTERAAMAPAWRKLRATGLDER